MSMAKRNLASNSPRVFNFKRPVSLFPNEVRVLKRIEKDRRVRGIEDIVKLARVSRKVVIRTLGLLEEAGHPIAEGRSHGRYEIVLGAKDRSAKQQHSIPFRLEIYKRMVKELGVNKALSYRCGTPEERKRALDDLEKRADKGKV